MVCHGELYRLRPAPERLTSFYLLLAAGGALGGIFVAIIAPLCFNSYLELPIAIIAVWLLLAAVSRGQHYTLPPHQWRLLACFLTLAAFGALDYSLWRLGKRSGAFQSMVQLVRLGIWLCLALLVISWLIRKKFRTFVYWRFLCLSWLLAGALGLAALTYQTSKMPGDAIYRGRNFYGVLTVYESRKNDSEEHYFLLQHGRVTHGLQFTEQNAAKWPTSYYNHQSGIGLAFEELAEGPRRVGLVGLGAGTLAGYSRESDRFIFYEINPAVPRIATRYFTYLTNCPGPLEIVPGDARLSLERQSPQQFDLLALDAFSSDAIPVHLLTREAFQLYLQHMKPDGLIAVHISNHYLNLEPVVANLARELELFSVLIDYDEDNDPEEWWNYSSTWILLAREQARLASPPLTAAGRPLKFKPGLRLWTDDFASLFQILQ
jgi:hypothetical protein